MNRGILTAQQRSNVARFNRPRVQRKFTIKRWHAILILIGLLAASYALGYSNAPIETVTKTVTVPETFYVNTCKPMPPLKTKGHSQYPVIIQQLAAAMPANILGRK